MDRKRLTTPALVLVLFLAGCTSTGDEADRSLSGTFTEETDQADLEDLERRLEPYGASLAVLESFPMQYRIAPLSPEDCEEVRALLGGLTYVRDVGTCQPIQGS